MIAYNSIRILEALFYYKLSDMTLIFCKNFARKNFLSLIYSAELACSEFFSSFR